MKKLLLTLVVVMNLIAGFPAMAETTPSKTVNINTASKEELMSLPGIGEVKANAIIIQREKEPFNKKEDLLLVKGIGEKMLEKISPHLTLDKIADAKSMH